MAKLKPESLHKLRRLRRARYLHKHWPLLAYHLMKEQYPGYSYEDYMADLTPRTNRRVGFRVKKQPLMRYGRFFKMQELLRTYHSTGDIEDLWQANRLRQRMHQPYQIEISKHGQSMRFQLPATTGYQVVANLVQQMHQAPTLQQAEEIFDAHSKTISAGR